MAHEASHFASKTRERTRPHDERPHGKGERTRRIDDRTGVSQPNPSGQDAAASASFSIHARYLRDTGQHPPEPTDRLSQKTTERPRPPSWRSQRSRL